MLKFIALICACLIYAFPMTSSPQSQVYKTCVRSKRHWSPELMVMGVRVLLLFYGLFFARAEGMSVEYIVFSCIVV